MIENPKENNLPEEVTGESLLDAVRRSGYPLQSIVFAELAQSVRSGEHVRGCGNEHDRTQPHEAKPLDGLAADGLAADGLAADGLAAEGAGLGISGGGCAYKTVKTRFCVEASASEAHPPGRVEAVMLNRLFREQGARGKRAARSRVTSPMVPRSYSSIASTVPVLASIITANDLPVRTASIFSLASRNILCSWNSCSGVRPETSAAADSPWTPIAILAEASSSPRNRASSSICRSILPIA
jgi:hypothetical protein